MTRTVHPCAATVSTCRHVPPEAIEVHAALTPPLAPGGSTVLAPGPAGGWGEGLSQAVGFLDAPVDRPAEPHPRGNT